MRTKGEVRHEMAVHDIEVNPREAGLFDDRGTGGEVGVVTGEDGGSEDRREHDGGKRGRLGRRGRRGSGKVGRRETAESGKVGNRRREIL